MYVRAPRPTLFLVLFRWLEMEPDTYMTTAPSHPQFLGEG